MADKALVCVFVSFYIYIFIDAEIYFSLTYVIRWSLKCRCVGFLHVKQWALPLQYAVIRLVP